MKITVGQTLWFVPYNPGTERYVTVERVGRKWFTVSEMSVRFSLKTLKGDTWRPGRCYLSVDHWREEREHDSAWRRLRDAMSRMPRPAIATSDNIRNAARLLGLLENVE